MAPIRHRARGVAGTTVLGALLLAAGCGTALPAPQATNTPVMEQPAAQATDTQVIAPSPTEVAQAAATGTWVPPTALAGTPIPGAEATLTAAPRLNRVPLSIVNSKGEKIDMTVEVADTPESRQLGLMFRPSMGPYEGMLFDFGGDTTSGFWMANTILPLSIAFITADGTIIDTQDMQPLDQTGINPAGAYRYALEVNQGFFRAHGIAPGDKVTLPGAQSVVIPGMPSCYSSE